MSTMNISGNLQKELKRASPNAELELENIESNNVQLELDKSPNTESDTCLGQNMKSDNEVCSLESGKLNQTDLKNFSFDPVNFTKQPICDERMMKNEVLKKIAGVLLATNQNDDDEHPDNCFYFEDTIVCNNFEINVENLGKLFFPLDKNYIEQLISISSEAKFGMGEKTVYDKEFRNTQMIESDKLDVKINQNIFDDITSKIHKALNLSPRTTLRAHLHNMLIYSPGQFFKEHRDSEKIKNMVATLVIVLPSHHVGGNLIIKHNNYKHTFSSENICENNARCICFFSDCLHEVKEIKDGFRVVLTYNIILDINESIDDKPLHNKYLEDAVREYFHDEVNQANYSKKKKESKKLIFLLNHSYSEHSLNWHLLKGEDYRTAFAFRSVADNLNLSIHIVLIDICQSWSTTEGSEYASSDEEFAPDLDSFIESIDSLFYWVDKNNEEVKYAKYEAQTHEFCFTQETNYENFHILKEEFSGPTGNEGSTVDYWYKRAAVVLWKKSDSIKVKFELNYQNALNELFALVDAPGNEIEVKGILRDIGDLLHKKNISEKYKYHDKIVSKIVDSQYFNNFSKIALYVDDENEAHFILSKFDESVLVIENIPVFIQLEDKYGITWFDTLIQNLMKNTSYRNSLNYKIIYCFIRKYLDGGGSRTVMEHFLEIVIDLFTSKVKLWKCKFEKGSDRYEGTIELFKACVLINISYIYGKLTNYLTSSSKEFPRDQLVKFYFDLQKFTVTMPSIELKSFRIQLIETLKGDIAKSRKADDWSISNHLWCPEFCDNCSMVSEFLTSNERIMKINENISTHIRTRLQRENIPVDVNLEGMNNNITVITKQDTIHTDAQAECIKLKTLLESLQ
nr:uncharacterized protein LOC111513730 [Leptinotarsa decemlineata]